MTAHSSDILAAVLRACREGLAASPRIIGSALGLDARTVAQNLRNFVVRGELEREEEEMDGRSKRYRYRTDGTDWTPWSSSKVDRLPAAAVPPGAFEDVSEEELAAEPLLLQGRAVPAPTRTEGGVSSAWMG